jgi:glutathione S-transferase
MRLIGLLDSPYVRRVAISLQLLRLPFEHRPISVFRGFDEFRTINPVVKAPTLVCEDGTVLMDSVLILQYAQALAKRSLLPADLPSLTLELRVIALAQAVLDKSVQLIYERDLRPAEKQYEPWAARVTAQMLAALTELEQELARRPLTAGRAMTQAGISSAVAWYFVQQQLPKVVSTRFPQLAAFSAQAEVLPQFRAAPHGDSQCVPVID